MVQLRIADQDGSNRLGYEKPFEEFVDLTKDLQGLESKEQKRLAIINKLLADQRSHALDHERGGAMFHGAALVRTKQGRWLLQANMHLQNAETTRNCAEANVVTEARGHEGKELQIAELWFMGGRANFEAGQEFLGNVGQRNSPCGSCLDIIYNNRMRVGEDTIVHMVPLNDGTMSLLQGDPNDKRDATEIEHNRVFSRTIRDLLPNISYQLSDQSGSQKSMMSKGYEWVYNPSAWVAIGTAIQQERLIELKTLEGENKNPDERMLAINKLLMETAKDYYQKAKVKPKSMTVAIVRATDGKYYIGKHSKDGITPATPSAEFEAVGAMINASSNKRLTDIFIVSLDQKELATLSDPDGVTDDISMKMPDGATREILKKFSPRNGAAAQIRDFFGKTMDQSGGNVHVFLPNNPDSGEFDSKKHVISMTVKELLPYAFQNPKGAGTENQPTH